MNLIRRASASGRSARDPLLSGGCLTFAQVLKHELGRGAKLLDIVEPTAVGMTLYPGRPHHVVVQFKDSFADAAGIYASVEEAVVALRRRAEDAGLTRTLTLQVEPHHAKRAREQGLKNDPRRYPLARPTAFSVAQRLLRRVDGQRAVGRRTVRLSTEVKVVRLWKATHALYEHDPEHFEGGCADISIALYFAAARAGWTGVQVVAGVADPPPVYPELDDAREVLTRLWEERAEDLGRPAPESLQGACKFGALLAHQVYGGEIEATWEHAWVRTDPSPLGWGIIDLPGPPYEGFVYKPDRTFMRRSEWKESLGTCAKRVKRWVDDLPVEDLGGPFLHVWLDVDNGWRFDPTWGMRMDTTNVHYQPEVTGREGLREAISRHGCEMMFEDRDTMLYYTDPAMPALRGEV